jgi:hypothetical protein
MDAQEVGQLAERLYGGYLVHDAAMTVAIDPGSGALAPPKALGDLVSVGRIAKQRGPEQIRYDFKHYLAQLAEPGTAEEYSRVWLTGALLALGDALSRRGYFDRAPELELVRHLRNAVAHGDTFEIRHPERLAILPAYIRTKAPSSTGDRPGRLLEVRPDLDGTPLWDFVEVPDVLSLFQIVSRYLLLLSAGRVSEF